MPISNAEKQARFRKKEQLNKLVSEVYRKCQFGATKAHVQRNFGDLEQQLRDAATLPSGWTDDDFDLAVARVQNIGRDIHLTGDPLGCDVADARNGAEGFRSAPNPSKWIDDLEKAKRGANSLAGHLVSALELAQLGSEDRAAALMEAVRHVGRALANSSSDGQSDAMAVCLASVNPHYDRPDWFVERFAKWLETRLDRDTRRALGERLLKNGGGF